MQFWLLVTSVREMAKTVAWFQDMKMIYQHLMCVVHTETHTQLNTQGDNEETVHFLTFYSRQLHVLKIWTKMKK